MDRKLLEKYFNDRCSPKELEQVLDWFQTDEGQRYLEEDIKKQIQKFDEANSQEVIPEIESEENFTRIQRHKKKKYPKHRLTLNQTHSRWNIARVASILLIIGALTVAGLYWSGAVSFKTQQGRPATNYITYATAPGQQKEFKISNRIKIWLNEKSVLKVPTSYKHTMNVVLKGEAYFEVTHNARHPFVVKANGAIIKDLGTKFNVKTDSAAGTVQVAVLEGKVKLKKEGGKYQTSAILTHNHFGMLNLADGHITIEKGNVKNYLSWKTNRLVFNAMTLERISQQLQHLYGVKISFQSDQLKGIRLTANYEKSDLKTILHLIARTLGINFKINGHEVEWMK